MDPTKSRPSIPLDDATRREVSGWVSQHWDSVYGHLFRISGRRHVAEDLAQETFLRAARQTSRFTKGTNLRAWLLRIATNAYLDLRRRVVVAKADPLADNTAAPEISLPGPDRAELNGALTAALAELGERERMVFLLRAREELSFREIAETIGCSEETARWHMLQARRRLMQLMEGWIG